MDWFRTPTRGGGGFGSGMESPFGGGEGGVETEEIPVELVGEQLRAAGLLRAGKGARFSDFVNLLEGYFRLKDVTLLDAKGRTTEIRFPELRVRLDDIEVVGQPALAEPAVVAPPEAPGFGDVVRIAKTARRAIVMTEAHIVYGSIYLHEEASLASFIDATDPRFMPMTDVLLRSLADRRQIARFPFALVQRSHILGVASGEGDRAATGDASDEPPAETEEAAEPA